MLSRSLLTRSGRSDHRLPLRPVAALIRDASRAMIDRVLDNQRSLWDRLSPLALLATLSLLPLVAVTSGSRLVVGGWLALSYLLAGCMWVDLAVKRGDRSHHWRAWGVGAIGLGGVALALPAPADAVLAAAIAVGAVAAIVAGLRLHAPDGPLAWRLLTGALVLAVAGQLGATAGMIRDDAVPLAASLVSLAGIAPLPIALWMLLHRRVDGSSRTSLLDTAIVTVGIGLLAWVFLIAPHVVDPAPSRMAQVILAGWPVVTLTMLVVAVRLLLARWADVCVARNLAGGALFLLIAAIVAASWGAAGATDPSGYPGLSIIWMLALIGFGATALHPSMRALAAPIHEHPTELDWQRGLLLTLSLLMAPTALVVQHTRDDRITIEVMAGGMTLLGLLFAARAVALQQARWQTRANDRLLRLAASDLIDTYGHDAIVQVALDTARRIAGDRATTTLYLSDGLAGEFVLQTESSAGPSRVVRERDLPKATRLALAAGTTAWLGASEVHALRVPFGTTADTAVVAISPISGDSNLAGLLISAGNRLDHDTARCLETLAAMLALALDRQRLADQIGSDSGRNAVRAQAADGTAFTFIDVDPLDGRRDPLGDDEVEDSIGIALSDAIERDMLDDRYQPRFDLVSGRITNIALSCEWDSPNGGRIPTGALAAIAAEHGLSQLFRQALLVRGCRKAAEMEIHYPDRPLDLVIPLSTFELVPPGLAGDVEFAMTATGCNPTRIVLQCPAATVIALAPDSIETLTDLAAIGVQIAISEAGASWSDLDRLSMLPLSTIELEPALVQRIDVDERSAAIAAHLINRAHTVGARSVAHGIDQRQHWISLRKLQGDIGQGNLFSPPLDAIALTSLLGRSRQRANAA